MTDHLRQRIATAVGKAIDDDPMHCLTDLAERLTNTVLAALLDGAERESRIRLDDLNSDQLDGLYDDLDRYADILGEMNETAVRAAKQIAELEQRAARAEAAAATPRELELRQRRAWSAAGQCPMCGYDDCGGRLCADCAATVRRLPSSDRRQWHRYEPIADSAPVQGPGYTAASLLGASPDPTETAP